MTDYRRVPAWINPHDHLELNHFPRTRPAPVYASAHDWGADVNARLNAEPYHRLRTLPLRDRLFSGGLKNLLCGALTVVQHNPPHRDLFQRDFPVRVVRGCTWAHSLHFTPPADLLRAYRTAQRRRVPFYLHLAEGTDDRAAGELRRLIALIGDDLAPVVIVHGVGLTPADISTYAPRLRGLIICPTTNRYLLNALPDPHAWLAAGGRLAIGSDSRLTADGDLLAERAAAALWWGDLPDHAGAIAGVLPASDDWIAVPAGRPLSTLCRTDLGLVVRGGQPQIGDPAAWQIWFSGQRGIPARLDGRDKWIAPQLARQAARRSRKWPRLKLWLCSRLWPTATRSKSETLRRHR